MSEIIKAKLFTHGGSQAVRLPKAFRFEGSEVRIHREGDRVILEPVKRDLAALWKRLDELETLAGEPFPDRPPQAEWGEPPDFDR